MTQSDTHLTSSQPVSGDSTIGVAFVGVGAHGLNMARDLRTYDRLNRIVCVDSDADRVQCLKQEHSFEATTSLEAVLASPDIRLVFITAANHAHPELTIKCLEAGKAVMCEKPMAMTLADARRMIHTTEQTGGFLQIGFECRYSKLYTTVKQWADAGLLGRIINTHCFYQSSEFHGKGSWRNDPTTGGSIFQEKLCHYVDLPRWWIGGHVTEVYAVSAPNIVPYFKVRDNYHATYRFDHGAVSHLTYNMGIAETFTGDPLQNMLDQQKDDGHALQYLITGTRGAAFCDVFRRCIKRWEYGDSPERMISKIVETHTWLPNQDHAYFHNTSGQSREIVDRVIAGKPPKTPAADAYQTMKLVYAADHSVAEGRVVTLDELT